MLNYLLMKLLKKINIKVIRDHKYNDVILKAERNENFIKILSFYPDSDLKKIIPYIQSSQSQFGQDFIALIINNCKSNGFFVEFGATNGKDLSNTYILEKNFQWSGILAEPAKHWHKDLVKNRSCFISTDCVWSKTNEKIHFRETEIKEISTVNSFSDQDKYSSFRQKGKLYEVNTISLLDLLDHFKAPKNIDYLSIDTEGSEFDVLENFDFSRYSFNLITCEHNFTENREKIYKLLTANGYIRILEEISHVDDWYVRKC